ncbi:ABC transporter permease [Mesorhizobium sp.]|uniref:ABC transporter permease n=1 Tax=Mesorhizobium sp. TaxID=1871066 RepID=UPI000FE8BDB1|nr:ABC transporter permease [Mesorhizobium sp.]RWK66565.1 MAG: ABC transporter permease [Mesorhizobium sp.]
MANYATEANASGLKPRVRRWRDLLREPVASICLLFLVFQLFCVGAALLFPDAFRYLTSSNVALLQRAIPVIGIVALGIGLLMITGEYDLSVGSVYTLAGYSMALLYAAGASAVVALLVTLVIGIVIGTINGLITVKTGIPSFIATMGSMLLVRGLVRWLSESGSVSFRPGGAFAHIFTGSIFGVEAAFIWFVLLACVAALLLHRSKLGNQMFLVGGSERTARAVGINTHRVKVIAFALSGLAARVRRPVPSGSPSCARADDPC